MYYIPTVQIYPKLNGYRPVKYGFHFLHGSAVHKVKSESDWSIVVLQAAG